MTSTAVAEGIVQKDRASLSVPYANSTMERWELTNLRSLSTREAFEVRGVYAYRRGYRQTSFDLENAELVSRRPLSRYTEEELRAAFTETAEEDIRLAEQDIEEYARSLLRSDDE